MKLLDTCLKVEIEGLILYYTILHYTIRIIITAHFL